MNGAALPTPNEPPADSLRLTLAPAHLTNPRHKLPSRPGGVRVDDSKELESLSVQCVSCAAQRGEGLGIAAPLADAAVKVFREFCSRNLVWLNLP